MPDKIKLNLITIKWLMYPSISDKYHIERTPALVILLPEGQELSREVFFDPFTGLRDKKIIKKWLKEKLIRISTF